MNPQYFILLVSAVLCINVMGMTCANALNLEEEDQTARASSSTSKTIIKGRKPMSSTTKQLQTTVFPVTPSSILPALPHVVKNSLISAQ